MQTEQEWLRTFVVNNRAVRKIHTQDLLGKHVEELFGDMKNAGWSFFDNPIDATNEIGNKGH